MRDCKNPFKNLKNPTISKKSNRKIEKKLRNKELCLSLTQLKKAI